jgi:hypothetical protein
MNTYTIVPENGNLSEAAAVQPKSKRKAKAAKKTGAKKSPVKAKTDRAHKKAEVIAMVKGAN